MSARAATVLYIRYAVGHASAKRGRGASVRTSASLKLAPSQSADRSEVGAVCASPWNLTLCVQGASVRERTHTIHTYTAPDACSDACITWHVFITAVMVLMMCDIHLLRCAPRSLRPSTRCPRARPPTGSPRASQPTQARHPRKWSGGSRRRRAERRRGRRLGRCTSRSVAVHRREQHCHQHVRGYTYKHHNTPIECASMHAARRALVLERSKPRRSIPV